MDDVCILELIVVATIPRLAVYCTEPHSDTHMTCQLS